MFRLYLAAGILAAFAASYTIGRIQGHEAGQAACEARVEAERAKLQSDLHAVSDDLSEAEQRYRDLERRLTATRRAFENATDPDACRLPADGVRRLIDRWGPAD